MLDLDIPQLDSMAVIDRLRIGGSTAHVLVHKQIANDMLLSNKTVSTYKVSVC